eukprot:7209287-Lingulodinium_polyedra.AAC.1
MLKQRAATALQLARCSHELAALMDDALHPWLPLLARIGQGIAYHAADLPKVFKHALRPR